MGGLKRPPKETSNQGGATVTVGGGQNQEPEEFVTQKKER